MKIQRKKLSAAVSLALTVGYAGATLAQEATHSEDQIEEIVVTAPFQQSEAETALPVGVLSGEALREKIGNSLGDTLKNEIGVANSSFGTGVGQVVIRGQSGNRVRVLQNGVGITDASSVSPDHAHGVNTPLAERVEVIRGPSALLYGSGVIGGVVNVIDNRIPESLPEEASFVVQQSHNTVSSQNDTLIRVDGAAGNVAFHLDAFTSRNDNVEISGYAIDEAAVEELEELIHEHLEEGHQDDEDEHHDDEDEHHDDEDEHHDEEEEVENVNTNGFIGNSDAESIGGNFGFSFIGDNGFFGVSISEVEKDYGLPLGVHSHAHGEEEHEDEHDEEEHHDEDEHEDEGGHAEEVEFVRVLMEKTRYDFKGELRLDDGFIQNIRANVGITDYLHDEVEVFADGGRETGTGYFNEGSEGRVTMTHVPVGDWTGVWGMQFSNTEFSAIGEEAFIPHSDLNSLGFFGVERYDGGNWTGELGIRFEDSGVDPNGRCEFSGNTTSLSGSLLYDVGADANFLFGASRSQRAPTVEELYSNVSAATCATFDDPEDLVLHASTNLLEIGNPLLEEETSNNIEFGYRQFGGGFTGEFSAYYNQIDNYIFLDLTGEEFEEQQLASYLARDARFTGIEAEVSFNVVEGDNSSLALGLFGDMVNAEFDSGGYVPRIPASKIGAELRWFGGDWSMHLHVTRVSEQEDAAELELPTGGYTLLSFYADYHWDVGEDSSLEVFLRGENLLDEEVRNHVSFLKNYAPEPGRGIMAGVRFEY